jgi:tetratricopeptide (TPR) repeat protein
LLAQGDLVHAEAELHTALKQQPDESAAHYDYGLVLEELDRTDEAREHYEKAVELDAEDPAPLIGLADLARRGGDLERSLELYRKALGLAPEAGLAPEDPLLVIHEAQALFELKRPDDGSAALRRLTGMSGASASDLTSAGILAGRHDQGDLAIELYRAALERDETYALAHLYWANALGRKKQFEEAAGHFERFIELAPEAPEAEAARKGLAKCRAQLGQ